jgi:hypothetical protein
MNAWTEYKKKLGDTRPWHIFDPSKQASSDDVSNARYSICDACPSLIKATKQCKECGCFMKLKVKLAAATCPLGKW